jgi:ABC-2 type transport system permease protein
MSTSRDERTVSAPPGAGVIHDIGYRHYGGARLGRAAIVRALYVDSLRGAFGLGRSAKSKVMPFLLLAGIAFPALVVAIVLNVGGQSEFPFELASYAFLLYIPLSLYVAGQAPASVSRDLRFRVVSLYFSRPLRRSDYVAAKYAALSTAVLGLLVLPLLLLGAGGLLAGFPASDTLAQVGRGLVDAAVTAPVMAGIGLLLASVTPRRGLGVAAVIAFFVVVTGVQNALQGLAVTQGRDDLATWTTLAAPISAVDTMIAWLFGTEPAAGVVPPDGAQGLAWVAVAVALVAVPYLLLLVRYRTVSVS